MSRPRLILVGGFLGAGKTTLIGTAAQTLVEGEHRFGVVVNDFAGNSVDAIVLATPEMQSAEVSAGCYCSRFGDLIQRVRQLRRGGRATIVFVEALGCCADLAQCVIGPLAKFHGEEIEAAPLTVVIDPARYLQAMGRAVSHFPEDVNYIVRMQVREADAVLINKSDLLPPGEVEVTREIIKAENPSCLIFVASARTGWGVEPWLEFVLETGRQSPRVLSLDYARYAAGELAIGWLNASVRFTAQAPGELDWAGVVRDVMIRLRDVLASSAIEIAHAKMIIASLDGQVTASLLCSSDRPEVRGQIPTTVREGGALLNVRALAKPEILQEAVLGSLRQVAVARGLKEAVVEIRSLTAEKSRPTYRVRE